MINRIILLASLIATVLIMVMLFFTTPTTVGPFGVFLFFVLVYVVVFGVATFSMKLFLRASQRRKVLKGRDYAGAALIAFWPIMILLLVSIGSTNLIVSALFATLVVVAGLVMIYKMKW